MADSFHPISYFFFRAILFQTIPYLNLQAASLNVLKEPENHMLE
jgi:hypothetical protein